MGMVRGQPPRGPYLPLPRESELPARRAMLERVRRQNPGYTTYRPPPFVYGPGGVTGEPPPAPRVRFRDVAVPQFFNPPRVPEPLPELPPMGGSPATNQPAGYEGGAIVANGAPMNLQPVQAPASFDEDAEWRSALERVAMALSNEQGQKHMGPVRRFLRGDPVR